MLQQEIREKIAAAENRLRDLREEKARAVKLRDAAKAAYEKSPEGDDGPAFASARTAVMAVQEIDKKIEAAQEDQIGWLRKLGDLEAGKSGFASPGVNGWEVAAQKLSLADGELRVDVSAASVLSPSLPPSPTSPGAAFVRASDRGAPADAPVATARWLYPVLHSEPFGSGIGDVTATDFTVTFDNAELTGGIGPGVERDPDATTEKATMSPTVALATPVARQFAAVLENVPSKVFDSQSAVRALLGNELARQLSESFDEHVVNVIEAANPPNGSTGANLIEKIRHAISDMHDLGGEPSVVALTPTDAAALDLSTDAGGYVFIPAATGQSTVWRLQVREVPSISAPTLIDIGTLGLIYTGEASVLLDPYTALSTNQVRARVEAEAVMHVRDIQQGAFQIA